MIKDMRRRITVDIRGKITTGCKSPEGYPQSLDYFDISDFPELRTAYGDKPDKLIVIPPSDRIEDFYDCNYVKWGKGPSGPVKIRQCDSEECCHRIEETIEGRKYEAGEISECTCQSQPEEILENGKMKPNPKRCHYDMSFKAFIAMPDTKMVENPACYLFETRSKNSGDALYSELDKIRALNMGVLRGIPFVLSVRMVGGRDDAKLKFPIWNMQAMGMLSEIRKASQAAVAGTPTLEQLPAAHIGEPVGEMPEAKLRIAKKVEAIWSVWNGVAKPTELAEGSYREALMHYIAFHVTGKVLPRASDLTEDTLDKISLKMRESKTITSFIAEYLTRKAA